MISTNARYAFKRINNVHGKNAILSRAFSEAKNTALSEDTRDGPRSHQHFLTKHTPHPLGAKNFASNVYEHDDYVQGDHTGRQQNHIWDSEEIDVRLNTLYRHKPTVFRDHIVNKLMYGLYHTFNFITGYKPVNPTVKSIEWRLIVLESIAGVPGATRNHCFLNRDYCMTLLIKGLWLLDFDTLKVYERYKEIMVFLNTFLHLHSYVFQGWISSLLEEAENERMHLLVCLKMFEANRLTR